MYAYVPDVGSLVWQRYGSGHVHGILLDGDPLASFERDAFHRESQRTQGLATHHFRGLVLIWSLIFTRKIAIHKEAWLKNVVDSLLGIG